MNYLLCAHRVVHGGGAPLRRHQAYDSSITDAPLAYGGPDVMRSAVKLIENQFAEAGFAPRYTQESSAKNEGPC